MAFNWWQAELTSKHSNASKIDKTTVVKQKNKKYNVPDTVWSASANTCTMRVNIMF